MSDWVSVVGSLGGVALGYVGGFFTELRRDKATERARVKVTAAEGLAQYRESQRGASLLVEAALTELLDLVERLRGFTLAESERTLTDGEKLEVYELGQSKSRTVRRLISAAGRVDVDTIRADTLALIAQLIQSPQTEEEFQAARERAFGRLLALGRIVAVQSHPLNDVVT